MNCKKAQELISLHIDNKLSLQEVNELNEHLSLCDKCKKDYNNLKQIKLLLNNKGNISLPSDFTKSTMDKIYAIKDSKPEVIHLSFVKRYLAMAASFIFVVCVSTYYITKQPNIDLNSAVFEAYNQTECDMEEIYEGDITSFLEA